MVKEIDALLAEHPFFGGMAPSALELFSGCGRNVHFEAGAYLAREGERCDVFFALRRGRVAVELHVPGRGSVPIQTLEQGEILGWSWLFPPYTWAFDLRAVEGVSAVAFDCTCLRAKCEAEPAFGYDLMKRFAGVFAKRLSATRLQLLDVYGCAPST